MSPLKQVYFNSIAPEWAKINREGESYQDIAELREYCRALGTFLRPRDLNDAELALITLGILLREYFMDDLKTS